MIQKPQVLGSKFAKNTVEKILSLLPQDVQDYTVQNITFIASFKDAWAYTLQEADIKGKYIIVLSDELLKRDLKSISYTLIHEIGHAISGHRNAIAKPQTKDEIKAQEKEAHDFTKLYAPRRIIYV